MQKYSVRISALIVFSFVGFGAFDPAYSPAQSEEPDAEGFSEKKSTDPSKDCPPDVAQECRAITDVLILMDLSKSMESSSRLTIAQWAAFDILDSIPLGTPTGLFALYDDAEEVRPLEPLDGESRSNLRRRILKLVPSGDGKLSRLVGLARQQLARKPDCRRPLIIVVTDGHDCEPYGAFKDVSELFDRFEDRLQIHLLGVNTNPEARSKLGELAGTRGHFFTVSSSRDLSTALAGIRKQLDTITCSRRMELATTQNRLTIIRTEFYSLERKWHSLSERIKESEQTIAAQIKLIHELQTTIKELQLRIGQFETETARFRTTVRTLQTHIDKLNVQVDELKSELIEKNELLVRRNLKLAEFKSHVSRLSAEKTELEGAIRGLNRDRAKSDHEKFIYQCGIWVLGSTVIALVISLGFTIYRLGRSVSLERETFRHNAINQLLDVVHANQPLETNPQLSTQSDPSKGSIRSIKPEGKNDDKRPDNMAVTLSGGESDRRDSSIVITEKTILKDYRVGRRIVENFQSDSCRIMDVNYFEATYRRVAEAYMQVCQFQLPVFGGLSEFDRLWSIRIDPKETWMQLDGRYRGNGAVGAMASISKAEIVDHDDIWSGQLLPGAVLQTWKKHRDFELARDGIRANDGGYSFLFLNYVKNGNEIVGMRIADEMSHNNRVLTRDDFDYWIAGNLHC
ncbi:MAG: VWA domain-containing protein [Planctomycetota bacterium]|nr:VWA domain-containing protein [Planctomycetota bacterium]